MSINKKLRKNNGDFAIKVILGTSLGLILIMASMLLYNNNKIKQLEDDLYLKQIVEERATDETTSIINLKTIRENLNEIKSYSVLKNSRITQTHTYKYEEDAWLGLKRKAELVGRADLIYSYDVRFDNATITQDDKGNITITIDSPTLDIDSVHMERDTLILEEKDYNIWCSEKDGEKVMRYYIESFTDRGIKNIEDMYNTTEKRVTLNKIAKEEVMKLVQTFNLNNCSITVKIR